MEPQASSKIELLGILTGAWRMISITMVTVIKGILTPAKR
jgi:hypothetical protein